jgi:cytochrome b561
MQHRPRYSPRAWEQGANEMNLSGKYTRTAMLLHWVIAVLIVANVALALSADAVPDPWVRPIIDTHKSIGITVLGLAILRLLWRAAHEPPPLPASHSRWERVGASATHAALYLLIFALPVSGWMHDSAWKLAPTHPMRWFNLIPWPRIGWIENLDAATKENLHNVFFKAHAYFGYALYVLLALHILATLKHQFFDKEREFERILPCGKAETPSSELVARPGE